MEPEEVERINRIRLSIALGVTPDVIDDMPPEDVYDALAVMRADRRIESFEQSKKKK